MAKDTAPRLIRVYEPDDSRCVDALERLLFSDLAALIERAEPTQAVSMPDAAVRHKPAEQQGSPGDADVDTP